MHGGYSYFLKKKSLGELYCAPWAIRILYSGHTWRFLNFRSFSFLKEFFLQKAEGKAWWVVKNVTRRQKVWLQGLCTGTLISKMAVLAAGNGASILPGLSVLRLK